MKSLSLAQIASMAAGTLHCGEADREIHAVSTDSRSIPAGCLFVALVGDTFDGHDFVLSAIASGATAVLVAESRVTGLCTELPASAGVIGVPDTLVGLQKLAAAYRMLLGIRVIAITGSNGKTSTKDFTRAVLATRFAVNATVGNLNNHIGLPITMLRQKPEQSHGVYELGMNHPGEIATLAALARPDVAVVTTLGTAHIEFFGTAEAIAEEKLSLFRFLSPSGTAVINLESPRVAMALERVPGKMISVGIDKGDVRATQLEAEADGRIRFKVTAFGESATVRLPVPGVHMVQNALLAIAVGLTEGVPLADAATALADGKLTKGRLQVKGWRGVTIIDDSYNANPDSMVAALHTLAAQPSNARRIAVLGKMGELGTHSAEAHALVGRTASTLNIDSVYTVGVQAEAISQAAGSKSKHFATHEACAQWLARELQAGDVVLLKGSRSAAMENVFTALEGVHQP